jgi:CBS domain containing-hemolysin-like protein
MDKKEDNNFAEKHNMRWVIIITIWTFIMAIVFSIITEGLVKNLNIFLAFVILVIIIFIGIFFDIIGIAVTTAEEKPFHAMAANRVEEAKYAIKLVKNAGQVSNFCNDVIGDISGIVSGAVGTSIIYKLINIYDIKNGSILSIIITSLVASLTVGGKALGKSIAISYSEKIIFETARIFNFLEKKFGIDILPDRKKNKNNKSNNERDI